jgi:hypothetical protein
MFPPSSSPKLFAFLFVQLEGHKINENPVLMIAAIVPFEDRLNEAST